MRQAELIMRLENRLPEIRRFAAAARALFDGASVPGPVGQHCVLATDEMLTNVIAYAWPMGGAHFIDLRVHVAADVITVELSDDGQPFNPLEGEAPDLSLSLEDRTIGGLGIHVARRAMDELHYVRVDRVNRLIMTKRIKERTLVDGSA